MTKPKSSMVPRKRGEPKNLASPHEHLNTLSGKCFVIDGDTICIGKVGIRLAGIDAPELDHPWGKKAK